MTAEGVAVDKRTDIGAEKFPPLGLTVGGITRILKALEVTTALGVMFVALAKVWIVEFPVKLMVVGVFPLLELVVGVEPSVV